jgi:hypothetical protein
MDSCFFQGLTEKLSNVETEDRLEGALATVYEVLRLVGLDRLEGAKSPAVAEAVTVLRTRLDEGVADPRVRHALGWWHEANAFTDPALREREHAIAVEILLPIYQATPEKVPETVASTLSDLGDRASALLVDLLRNHQAGMPGVDLNRAIDLGDQAVTATPKDHPDHPGRLSNLAVALQTRFARTGQLGDLNRAIDLGDQAVTATPKDHPDHPMYLSNLGNALRTRF